MTRSALRAATTMLAAFFITACSHSGQSGALPPSGHRSKLSISEPAIVQTATGSQTNSSLTQWSTPALTATPSVGHVLVLAVSWNTAASSLQSLSGWTEVGSESYDPTYYNSIALYCRIVQSGDNGSATLKWSSGSEAAVEEYEISGEDASAPCDAYGGNKVLGTTLSVTSGTPRRSALPLAFFSSRVTHTFSSVGSGWTQDITQTAGFPYMEAQFGTETSSSIPAQLTFGASGYQVGAVVLIEAAATAYAYHPSYIYEGNFVNTNNCGGAPCITTSTFQTLNIRYAEGDRSGTWQVNGPNICNGNLYCNPVWYNSVNNVECDTTQSNEIFTALDPLTSGDGDPAFLHKNSASEPFSHSVPNTQRLQSTSAATCPQGAPNPPGYTDAYGVYLNPNDSVDIQSAENTNWFNDGYDGLNGDTRITTRWDNGSLVNDSAEFGLGNQNALNTYMMAYWNLFKVWSGFPQGFNAGGSGGGDFRATGSGDHVAFGCAANWVCNDPDAFCAANPGAFTFVQWERPLTNSAYKGSTNLERNIGPMLDTAAQYYNDTGCNRTDMVELEPVTNSAGSDSRNQRDLLLAVRMLLDPGDYDGTQKHRAWVMERYSDCAACDDQVSIFPEDGLQFIPETGGMAVSQVSGDGNGCNGSGGAATFVVACAGTDVQGYAGAIYGRAGECFEFGTDIGKCVVLVNQSDQNQLIQDTWCQHSTWPAAYQQPCSSYPMYWYYGNSGPENLVDDSGATICPQQNGCLGTWGEKSFASVPLPGMGNAKTLGACTGPLDDNGTPSNYNVLSVDCSVVLLSQ